MWNIIIVEKVYLRPAKLEEDLRFLKPGLSCQFLMRIMLIAPLVILFVMGRTFLKNCVTGKRP
jgi:hypothetical protein